MFVGGIQVVYVVGRVLKITNQLTRFRADREHAAGEQTIQIPARSGIVWLRIARSPVNKIELRIVRTGAPGRTSASRPGVAILWPCLGTGLAGRWNGISAPQSRTGVRSPAVEEPARGGLSPGHAGNQYAVGNNRSACGVVAVA